MADPVSLAASIVTLVTLVNFTVQTVRSISNGPVELQELTSELEDIKSIADELNRLKDDTAERFLTAHIRATHKTVSQLQTLLEKCKYKNDSDVQRISSWAWLRRRNRIVRLSTKLRNMKAILLDDANIITLIRMSQLTTAFEMSTTGSATSTIHFQQHGTGNRSKLIEDQQRFCSHLQIIDREIGLQNLPSSQTSSLTNVAIELATGDSITTLASTGQNHLSSILPWASFFVNELSKHQSPVSPLESSSSFYGEAYTVENVYGSNFFASSCLTTFQNNRQTVVYTVDFAVDSRHRIWTTIVVDAPIGYDHEVLRLIPDGNNSSMIRGDFKLTSQLERVIRQNGNLYSGSGITLCLENGGNTDSIGSHKSMRLLPPLRSSHCHERLLSLARNIGCTLVHEKQIEFLQRRYSNIFDVIIDSRRYIYRQIQPEYLRRADHISKIEAQIKALHDLRESTTILGLVAVVLDDSLRHVKGYLLRWVGGSNCTSASEWMAHGNVSWIRRQRWARCYVEALAEFHSVGYAVGRVRHGHIFGNLFINDQDVPSLLLRALEESIPEELMDQRGTLAPETRFGLHEENVSTASDCTFEIDLFNLGMMLWLISYQYPIATRPCFCRSIGCTTRPRSQCFAEHTNPITLPTCSDPDVPVWYQGIISFCRNHNPACRKSARELLTMFQKGEEEGQQHLIHDAKANPPSEIQAPKNFAVGYLLVCSECTASVALSGGYHCEICDGGDFDLCLDCASQRFHCYDPRHTLLWQEKEHYSMVRTSRHPPLVYTGSDLSLESAD